MFNKYSVTITIFVSFVFSFLCLLYISNATAISFDSLLNDASNGNANDQFFIGELYYNGVGTEPNYSEAFKWYKKAAEKNHIDAQYSVGFMLEEGQGVVRNPAEAAQWLEKAAQKGHVQAQVHLANIYSSIYSSNEGIKRNNEIAFKWYKKAADQGDPRAYYALGKIFENGDGVSKNYAEALFWYKKAAEKDERFEYLTKGTILKNELRLKIKDKISNLSFSFIIGLILAVIGIYATIKSKKDKKPSYALWGFNLVKNFKYNIESLEMLHKGEKIENLTVTKLAFWNAGRETINNQDIVTIDPPRIIIKDEGEILDAKIIDINNPSNNFSIDISKEKNSILLNFDYIDKNDGIILQILHTNLSPKSLELIGKIKGSIYSKKKIIPKKSISLKQFLLSIGPILLIILLLFSQIFFLFYKKPDFLLAFIDESKNIAITYFSITILCLFYAFFKTINYIKNRIPKEIHLFDEEIK